ncbi:hypothetical protein PtA15_10A522 [Puccinia triticina]|uniref:Uncharacterized protein n=1 Tax=Puccinia triticina TaxID=208348 RepID=A0ABY7CXL9_9BASI|nr:uncharacterized protein PtA15_10A522 [Puccinia triticina]WAQ89098.1 hypothetical protein PtA15_10A522 [Puccinia triticina]
MVCRVNQQCSVRAWVNYEATQQRINKLVNSSPRNLLSNHLHNKPANQLSAPHSLIDPALVFTTTNYYLLTDH